LGAVTVQVINVLHSSSAAAVDPRDPRTIYAVRGRIERSTDGGRHWRLTPERFAQSDFVTGLVVDPSDPRFVYVGGETSVCGWVDMSTDGGATWTRSLDLGGSSCAGGDTLVNGLAIDPNPPGTLYAGTDVGPYVSRDHGHTWKHINDNTMIVPLAVDASSPRVLYGTADGNLFRSTDGGVTWPDQLSTNGEFGQGPLAISPLSDQTLALTAKAGVFGTSDGGQHWTYLGFTGGSVLQLAFDPMGSTLYVVVAA
jgi:photosystem II stability/assembly factor-like uncharacterized protein